MLLTELFNPAPVGYYNPDQDQSQLQLSDVRKTRITLAQLSILRHMSDLRKAEHEQSLQHVQRQYAMRTSV